MPPSGSPRIHLIDCDCGTNETLIERVARMRAKSYPFVRDERRRTTEVLQTSATAKIFSCTE
jgi:hypothetical protein